MLQINQQIAAELKVGANQIDAAVKLLDEGSTVPFIARYRKEVTGALDDAQLRDIEQRLGYLRELEDRRAAILKSIDEQEKLTTELESSIKAASTKSELEDLYLPYKPKRRTKAQIAKEAGLEPLAMALWQDPSLDPEAQAAEYLNDTHKILTNKDALDGAKQILMELFAENAELIKELRDYLWASAHLKASVMPGKEKEGIKYSDYFEHHEAINAIPSHRTLALLRGRNESILSLQMISNLDLIKDENATDPCLGTIAQHFNIQDQKRPADSWLQQVVLWTWKIKLHLYLETELMGKIREEAETEAIRIFAKNLSDLLMAAPAGAKITMGIDPGLRTGCKAVIVDETGKLLAHSTIFPHAPQKQWDQSLRKLETMCKMHKVELVSIGNGTASRETDKLVSELLKIAPELKMQKIMVSEAGASVYSASALASQEFPDLDVSYRGSVSIARRLQDPLPELVKIDPKSIGVGQYQHDVSQSQLARSLDGVVEDCVNAVGVDLNMASVPLLTRVSGLSKTIAQNIINWRNQHGRFESRQQLLEVERMGPKTFEQAAGFLRISAGSNALDSSAVHPESYPLVEKIMSDLNLQDFSQLLGNQEKLNAINSSQYIDDQFGLHTVNDILKELDKPGRDPRPEFKMVRYKDGVETLKDLKPNMELEGVITNVTAFGAFVDIGVHQDGLVHLSNMANRFIKDPAEVVKAGDIVRVWVMDVDIQRKRIGLSMVGPQAENSQAHDKTNRSSPSNNRSQKNQKPRNKQLGRQSTPQGAFANALADAFKK
ncbi:Tex family protein [Kangiella sp. HZ709]|uniref:Tex family protein n=1 Tax=Kangiella sp. HZ709 TaxID=2666328 RepID=UPI0012AFEA0E|nr:Tex family protein [Kangiella sp. HZ709]MRX28210.1 S1 RNA-binding domain-containing protein [Kangiella sp. HZ709]